MTGAITGVGGAVFGLAGGALSGVTNLATNMAGNIVNINMPMSLRGGHYFAIKKGILYEYRDINSREAIFKIPILKIYAVDKNYSNKK